MFDKILQWLKKRNDELSSVSSWVNLLVVVIAGLVSIHFYFKDRVKEIMKSPEMVELVSSQIRPVVIFDSEKRIISGKSALQYFLSDFDVLKNEKGEITEISIVTKELLRAAPILEGLDRRFRINSQKGEKFKWIYSIKPPIEIEDSATPKVGLRFRLEFLD